MALEQRLSTFERHVDSSSVSPLTSGYRNCEYLLTRRVTVAMCDSIKGTRIAELVDGLEEIYKGIENAQAEWKKAAPFRCPDGCGTCCEDFEPDVLESEALYLAAWILENQGERAAALLSGTFQSLRGQSPKGQSPNGCLFFDPDNPHHCTVYGGRALICRLFGYTGDRGKDGRPRWKPCKLLPRDLPGHAGNKYTQYSEADLLASFGIVPPLMADITSQALSLSPDSCGERRPLRDAVVRALEKIMVVIRLNQPPETPEPLAS